MHRGKKRGECDCGVSYDFGAPVWVGVPVSDTTTQRKVSARFELVDEAVLGLGF
jgi:hypothetical protein